MRCPARLFGRNAVAGRSTAVVLGVAVALAGAACSSGTESTQAGQPGSTASSVPGKIVPSPRAGGGAGLATAITIKGFAFEPIELAAKVGDTVTVTNGDGTDHTVTAVDGSFDTGRFASGDKTFRVGAAGRFEFRCDVHSFMPRGSIQVSG